MDYKDKVGAGFAGGMAALAPATIEAYKLSIHAGVAVGAGIVRAGAVSLHDFKKDEFLPYAVGAMLLYIGVLVGAYRYTQWDLESMLGPFIYCLAISHTLFSIGFTIFKLQSFQKVGHGYKSAWMGGTLFIWAATCALLYGFSNEINGLSASDLENLWIVVTLAHWFFIRLFFFLCYESRFKSLVDEFMMPRILATEMDTPQEHVPMIRAEAKRVMRKKIREVCGWIHGPSMLWIITIGIFVVCTVIRNVWR